MTEESRTFNGRSKTWVALAACVIIAAGLIVYANSFAVPFVFDDLPTVRDNPGIRQLGTAWRQPAQQGITISGRPLAGLSVALNYAVSGTHVWSYHLFNVAIHLLCGLTLFGIVRRTFSRFLLERGVGSAKSGSFVRSEPADRNTSHIVAIAAALLWTVHPLQTESVTYIAQRVESMMGLFYLLTLYCFIRYADRLSSEAPSEGMRAEKMPANAWIWPAVLASLCGMACKEVMVTAPLLVVLYDRTFLSGSFREAWRRHHTIFLGLAATWLLLVFEVAGAGNRGGTAGYGAHVGPWRYALAQCPAILHYLGLCFWPHPLVFDYGWGLAWDGGVLSDEVIILPRHRS